MKIGFLLLSFLSLLSFSSNTKTEDFEEYTYSLDELKQGVYLNEEMFFENDGFKYQLNNLEIGNNCYLVIGEYEEGIPESRLIDSFPYLAFYQNNILKWKFKSTVYGYGRFTSAIILDDKIIVAGTFERENQILQIGLFEFNYNGDILNYYFTTGNDNSICENIYFINDSYYVTGETKATNLGYGSVDNNKHILVMAFTKKFMNYNNLYISNDNDSKLYKSFSNGETITIFGKVTGDGYFNIEEDENILCVISERLDIDSYDGVKQNEDCHLLLVDDNIMFFEITSDPSKMKVIIYGRYKSEERYLKLALNVFKMESYKVIYSKVEDTILIGLTLSNNNIYYDKLITLDKDLKEIYSIEIEKKDYSLLKYCNYIEGNLYSFGLENDKIYGKKILEAKMIDKECFFNGNLSKKIVEQVNENIFGLYDQTIVYKYNNIMINTIDKIYIEPICSIKDKGVYEKNFILEFNGEGYLNGIKIDSGYLVSENGNYLLEVIGKDERMFYSFVVKDLSISDSYNKYNDLIIKEVEEEIINNEKEMSFNNNLDNYESNNEIFFIVIIFIILGLVIGVMMPIERIGRKRA